MTNANLSRRKLLERSLQIPLGGALLAAAAAAQAAAPAGKVCVDFDQLDAGARSIRESLNYVEKSADPAKTCANCGFYEAKGDGCGNCMIFTALANGNGFCDSWSSKS
jgi:hypothetical protein